MNQISGKIHLIGSTESVGNNGFTKRQIVIETSEQYPQKIAIDFLKDKTTILDKYAIGQEVAVDVNLRGSEFNGKYYVNLTGWKINASAEQVNNVVNQVVGVYGQAFETVSELNDPNNDLPFN